MSNRSKAKKYLGAGSLAHAAESRLTALVLLIMLSFLGNAKGASLEAEFAVDLLKYKTNIVIEFNDLTQEWIIRRSGLKIEIAPAFVQSVGKEIKRRGNDRLLLSLGHTTKEKLSLGLKNLSDSTKKSASQIFLEAGVPATDKPITVVLIPAYGDAEGRPLSYAIPVSGVEGLAYQLNREIQYVDARVYNPNLTSIKDLYEFLDRVKPDIIGMNVFETVLPRSLEIAGYIKLTHPKAKLLWGGPTLSRGPLGLFLQSLDLDGISIDDGRSFLEAVKIFSKDKRSSNFDSVDGIVTRNNLANRQPEKPKRNNTPLDLLGDVPMGNPDLTHGKSYSKDTPVLKPIPHGKVGRSPFFVNEDMLGNGCKGKCIYCSLPLNTLKPKSSKVVADYIRANFNPSVHDSIFLGAPDIFDDTNFLWELLSEFEKDPFLRSIPKRGTGRVDYGDPKILHQLARAGFETISLGVETFDTQSLKAMGKHTTGEQNRIAMEETFKAGMYPSIYHILMSLESTVKSVQADIHSMVDLALRGASIVTVPYLGVFWGLPLERHSRTEKVEYFFPGMTSPLETPREVKYRDPRLRKIKDKMLSLLDSHLKEKIYPKFAGDSLTVYSLLIYKSFLEAVAIDFPNEVKNLDDSVKRIDQAILRVLISEARTTEGVQYPELESLLAKSRAGGVRSCREISKSNTETRG